MVEMPLGWSFKTRGMKNFEGILSPKISRCFLIYSFISWPFFEFPYNSQVLTGSTYNIILASKNTSKHMLIGNWWEHQDFYVYYEIDMALLEQFKTGADKLFATAGCCLQASPLCKCPALSPAPLHPPQASTIISRGCKVNRQQKAGTRTICMPLLLPWLECAVIPWDVVGQIHFLHRLDLPYEL